VAANCATHGSYERRCGPGKTASAAVRHRAGKGNYLQPNAADLQCLKQLFNTPVELGRRKMTSNNDNFHYDSFSLHV